MRWADWAGELLPGSRITARSAPIHPGQVARSVQRPVGRNRGLRLSSARHLAIQRSPPLRGSLQHLSRAGGKATCISNGARGTCTRPGALFIQTPKVRTCCGPSASSVRHSSCSLAMIAAGWISVLASCPQSKIHRPATVTRSPTTGRSATGNGADSASTCKSGLGPPSPSTSHAEAGSTATSNPTSWLVWSHGESAWDRSMARTMPVTCARG